MAGVDVECLPAALKHVVSPNGDSLVAVQEVPRSTPGWHKEEKGDITILSFQDDASWRGVGVVFQSREWTVMRRKGSGRAAWMRMRRLADGQELWLGVAHFSQGVSCAVHQQEVQSALALLPATTLPCVFGVDGNAAMGWGYDEQVGTLPVGREAKSNMMIGSFERAGFQLGSPGKEQFHTPTSRPRKMNARGNCIDFLAFKHAHGLRVRIEEGSHATIDTDPDCVVGEVRVAKLGSEAQKKKKIDTRPRRLTGTIPPQTVINQQVMRALAKRYTAPQHSTGYRDPADVRTLFEMAKTAGTQQAWKTAHRARRRARMEWAKKRLEDAAQGDWREAKRRKVKVGRGWEMGFSQHQMEQGVEPHDCIHRHFDSIFNTADTIGDWFEGDFLPARDFTEQELVEAVGKAKLGKSVGVDETSAELFRGLMEEPSTVGALLAWYNSILHTGELPDDWGHSLMVVLPKTAQPLVAKDLRPIAMGSAAGKVFSRMLLARADAVLQPETHTQCACKGRQTADYMFTIARTMDLEREWRGGAVWVKLDISKAFDSLRREVFLKKLLALLGRTEEARCWIRSLQGTSASLCTMCGESFVPMRVGIKQGGIESPTFFAKVMEWAFHQAGVAGSWSADTQCFPGLEVPAVAFMDDAVLWERGVRRVRTKLVHLTFELQRWGLKVNPSKSQVYLSPYAEPGDLEVDGAVVPQSDELEVMGVGFSVKASCSELLQATLAKVRRKFWADKEVICGPGPLAARLRYFDRVVAGSALWCAAAIIPDRQALMMVNAHLYMMVGWMMNLKRRPGEDWLGCHIRSLRAARAAVHRVLGKRWSTKWLRRVWRYAGHRIRGGDRASPPGSTLISHYRTGPWWREQQADPNGVRHPGRFFPKLSIHEHGKVGKRSGSQSWMYRGPQGAKVCFRFECL